MAEFDMDVVRARLRAAMKAKKIGAKPLSIIAGLGETAVRDIREGKSVNPGVGTLAKLAAALDVSLDHILGIDIVPSNVVAIWSAIPDDDKGKATSVLEAFRRPPLRV